MANFMTLSLLLFSLSVCGVYHVSAACLECPDLLFSLEEIHDKLDMLLGKTPATCKPIQINAVNLNAPKKVISNINKPFGAIADGNDVYITGYDERAVYRFDQTGTQKERSTFPTRNPTFIDIHDGKMYVTDHSSTVYTKPLSGNQGFTRLLTQHLPVGIKVSDDGEKIYVTEWNTGKINVYNKNLEKIHVINVNGITHPREVSIDSEGNIQVSTYTNKFYIYNKNYQLVEQQVIQGAVNLEGYYVHCDGTKVLADRSGKLIFADKDGKVLRIVTGFSSTGDVALTSDGTLFVSDFGASKLYLFSVYASQAQSSEWIEMSEV